MEIPLRPEAEQIIRQQMEAGRYHDAGEVIGEALHLLQARDRWWQGQAEGRAELQRRIAAGLAEADRGEGSDAGEVFAELEREAEQAVAAPPPREG